MAFEPYVGPQFFTRADGWRFFGRDQETQLIQTMIFSNRVSLLCAQSGAGKTSLLGAKLIPELESRRVDVLSTRVGGSTVATDEKIDNIFVYNAISSERLKSPTKDAEMSLSEYLAVIDRGIDEDKLPAHRVLIFDQFEEIFTDFPDTYSKDRHNFFQQITQALENDRLLRVLFSMREEYLTQIDPYLSDLSTANLPRFRLELLREQAALTAVVQPVLLKGSPRKYEPHVAEMLVTDLMSNPANKARPSQISEFVEPVLLQVVCQDLWERTDGKQTISAHDLKTSGDIEDALLRFFDRRISKFCIDTNMDETRLRRWIETEFITERLNRAKVPQGFKLTGSSEFAQPNEIADALINFYILRKEVIAGVTNYELIHDRLVSPIKRSNQEKIENQREAVSKLLLDKRLLLPAIAEVLLPLMSTEREREAIILEAFTQKNRVAVSSIDFSGNPLEFCRRLVANLYKYGNLPSGNSALTELLSHARERVGVVQRAQIDTLLDSLTKLSQPQQEVQWEIKPPKRSIPKSSEGYVFINYARKDYSFVNRFVNDLHRRGVDTWIDQQNLTPGTANWEQAIRDGIEASNTMLLFASPDARRSHYVRDELAIAQAYQKRIIPIWVNGDIWVDSVPLGMAHIQFVDARGQAYETALNQVLEAIRSPHSSSNIEQVLYEVISPKPASLRNPYKGLAPFGERDSGDYFGRSTLIDEMLETLLEYPNFLAVIGASGSGKSSAVLAGLIPALKTVGLPYSSKYTYLSPIVPGFHPVENLAFSILEAFPHLSLSSVKSQLQTDSRSLLNFATQLSNANDGTRCFLYIDQFEELFVLTASDEERQNFIDLISEVARPDARLTIVLSLRADFYDRPLNYASLGKLLEQHSVTVLPMTLADLYDAIVKPAEQSGLEFDPDLVTTLMFDVRGQAGMLPLLQFTLAQLYERRVGNRLTMHAYRQLGGVSGALATHAEATYKKLPDDQMKMVRALFLRLVSVGEQIQDTTRRRIPFSELRLSDEQQSAVLRSVVEIFTQARLLTTSGIGGEASVEISHEILIREWGRLQKWLTEARFDVQLQQKIVADATDWVRQGKKADYLYRGILLQEAQDWEKRNLPSQIEVEFIVASRELEAKSLAAEEARRVRLIQVSRVAFVISFFAVVLTIITLILNAALANTTNELQAASTQVAQSTNQIRSQGLIAQAQQLQATNPELALALALAATELDPTALDAQYTLANIAYNPGTVRRFEISNNPIFSMTLNPDGQYAVSIPIRGPAVLWNTRDGSIVQTFQEANRLSEMRRVAFSPSGEAITIGGCIYDSIPVCRSGAVVTWNIASGEIAWDTEIGTVVDDLNYSADGKSVVVGGCIGNDEATCPNGTGVVAVFDSEIGTQIFDNTQIGLNVSSVVFGSNNHQIVVSLCTQRPKDLCENSQIQFIDTITGEIVQIIDGISAAVTDLSVDLKRQQLALATAQPQNLIKLYDLATGRQSAEFEGHTASVLSIDFSPDGTQLLSSSEDNNILLWDSNSNSLIQRFIGHDNYVSYVEFFPAGEEFVSGSFDGSARVWTTRNGALSNRYRLEGDITSVLSVSSNGELVVGSVMIDGSAQVAIWNALSGEFINTYPVEFEIHVAAFSHDNRFIAIGGTGDKSSLALLDREAGELRYYSHVEDVFSVAFNPTGDTFVSAGFDGILMWNIEDLDGSLISDTSPSFTVAYSLDGAKIARGTSGQLAVYATSNPENSILTRELGTNQFAAIAFSPDSQWLIGVGDTIAVWNLPMDRLYQLAGHSGYVYSVDYSPLGDFFITSGLDDHHLILWDSEQRQPLRAYIMPGEAAIEMQLTEQQDALLAVTRGGDVVLWRIDSLEQLTAWIRENRYITVIASQDG